MRRLILRNLRVYFRDRLSVFFSLLSVIITYLMYLLFLGDVWSNGVPDVEGARAMMGSWIMAGLLTIASVTTTLSAASTMVDDLANKIRKDFEASPISRAALAGSYMLSSFLVGAAMTLIGLVLAEAYIVYNGGELLSLFALLKLTGVILLSTLSSTAFFIFLFTFLKTNAAVGTVSTLAGTLIGFLTGIYIPIGELPEAVQGVVKALPVSHAAVLMRQIMMEKPLATVFAGAPQEVVNEVLEEFGLRFSVNGSVLPAYISVLILAATAAVFFGLSAWRMTKKQK
ncbi:MAG: ABC transporter permease [Clostridiaceae bacterium]|nr:ABC transporter permease [Eubacteriales bacterium]